MERTLQLAAWTRPDTPYADSISPIIFRFQSETPFLIESADWMPNIITFFIMFREAPSLASWSKRLSLQELSRIEIENVDVFCFWIQGKFTAPGVMKIDITQTSNTWPKYYPSVVTERIERNHTSETRIKSKTTRKLVKKSKSTTRLSYP